jgi:OmcA/MtrC family decaheme c-type cytochrome
MGFHVGRGLVSAGALAGVVAASSILLGDTPPGFTKRDKAFFADPAVVNFVRPGLVVKIRSASIAADGTMQADILIADPQGLPLDRAGVNTPGAVSVSFVPAVLPNNATEYQSYSVRNEVDPASGRTTVEATADSGGSFQPVADGEYVYTFHTKVPAGDDPTATHTVGLYSSRDLTQFNMGTQYSNDIFSWVPSGVPVTHVHDEVSTAACNQCHDPLEAHGGARQDVRLCVLCHTEQTTDAETNRTLDFRVFIHKVHMGADLPSVQSGTPYTIVGFQNAVNDYSDVVFPALGPNNCQFCHQPANVTAPAPSQANVWMTRPSRAACGACHDNVNFDTGENHANLPELSDNLCSTCHTPQGSREFDLSITGAHLIAERSTQLPGVVFAITNIGSTGAGQNPQVTFTLKNTAVNANNPSDMNFLNLVLAWPTTDYAGYAGEDARKSTANTDGSYTYTFSQAIPAGTTGSGSVGIEGYRNFTLNAGTVQATTARDVGQNVDVSFAITGTLQARRAVVTTGNCNSCHDHLEAHGGIRNEIAHCVLCHNPNATDQAMRPANQMPPQGIAFKMLIHRVHTGSNQESDYTIYGFGGSKNTFLGVLFPGDRRDCEKCHVPNSQELPLPSTEIPVVNPRGFIDPQGSATAACLGCHTDQASAAHASLNASPTLGEACAVCHGVGADFAVDVVHAR